MYMKLKCNDNKFNQFILILYIILLRLYVLFYYLIQFNQSINKWL